ncbi:MAG: discoidin domain-containing protein [Bacteroidales bacterium]|nr:discoidin domain-containing protein [Bacteroidales bacterium]
MKKVLISLFPVLLFQANTLSQKSANGELTFRNLALRSVVTVSSVGEKGLIAEKAVDGDTLTRWTSAFNDNEWIELDLGQAYFVDHVIIRWEAAYAKAYKLLYSHDGDKWDDAYSEEQGDGKTDEIILPSLFTRYLKLLCLNRATPYGISLWELEVYNYSKPIGITYSFNGNLPATWSSSENCDLTMVNNTLRISSPPASPGSSHGCFAFALSDDLSIDEFPQIGFLSQTDKPVRLLITLKFHGGYNKTYAHALNPDNRWHQNILSLDSVSQQPLKQLYFQLFPGNKAGDTIILYMDELALGFNPIPENDTKILKKLIDKADKYILSSTREKTGRQFHDNAVAQYMKEIEYTSGVLNCSDLTQTEIDKATNRLIKANAVVESSVIKPRLPVRTCDPDATLETQYFYNNMKAVEGRHIFFGQMDPFFSNVTLTGKPFQSDVEDICGSLPALGSWELKDIALGFGYDAIVAEAEYYYSKNGIVSFCWHMVDPTGSGIYLKDLPEKKAGNELLPGGKYHSWFTAQLDRIAFAFQQMKGPDGESVPILFRPFHEMDGDWFWWGKPYVSPDTFAKLWQFTFNYLVSVKKVNNLLFVFSPCDRFKKRDGDMGYLDYYPGDDYVDVLAQDNYWQVRNKADSAAFVDQLRIMTQLAAEKNKIAGLSETGLADLSIPDWFTSVLLKPIKNDSLARKITYMAIWNKNFVPYPGHTAAPDFLKFFHDPVTWFIGDYPDLYHALINP